MELKELHDYVKFEDQRLRDLYPYGSDKELVLHRMCKLTEEVGELSEQVLKSLSFQRKEKMLDVKRGDLEDELVDVLITAFLLGESLSVDMEKAIGVKVDKIKNRNYN